MFKYSSALLGIVVSFLAFAQNPNRRFISISNGTKGDDVVVNVNDGQYQISFFDDKTLGSPQKSLFCFFNCASGEIRKLIKL